MSPSRTVPSAFLVMLGAFGPGAALATSWQQYDSDPRLHYEIDADSVRVSDGLVKFQHRIRFIARPDPRYERALDAVVDCAGRREADVTGGKLLFFPVDEGSSTALELDTACRIAGVATTPGPSPEWQPLVDGSSIDLHSIRLRDGLLFFAHGRVRNGASQGSQTVVVDCAARQRSEVAGEHYTLQRIVEGGSQARQAEAACRVAKLAMPPGPTVAPVDFDAVIAPEMAGDDNLLHDIVRPSLVSRDGVVHFQYATRLLSDGSQAQEDQRIAAVVEFATRHPADEVDGKFVLRPVAPGTRGALQVTRVCAMAATQAGQ